MHFISGLLCFETGILFYAVLVLPYLKFIIMAEQNKKNNDRSENQTAREPRTRRESTGGAPRTTQTGAQNNGGQSERAADTMKKNKHGGGR